MLVPNQVLSKELHVKPLREGEVAVYKMCASDELDLSRQDEETGKFRNKSPGYTLAKKYSVYDPKQGRRVIIGNVVGVQHEEMLDKSLRTVETCASVRFELGKNLTITHLSNDTFQFLERLDQNRDNPFRNPKKKAMFYRVSEKRQAQDKNYKSLVLTDALNWIAKIDAVEMKVINTKLPDGIKMDLNLDWEILKAKLFDMTLADPVMIMKASSDIHTKYKIQVMDAAKYQIILFDEGDAAKPRAWYFNRGEDVPKICDVEVGKNKVEALADHFKKDGAGMYKKVIMELNAFLKSGFPEPSLTM